MAGADQNLIVNELMSFDANTKRPSIAAEIISRTKERKQIDPRGAKSPYNSKYIPKRNSSAYYKPAYSQTSAFLPKGRHQPRRSSVAHKPEYRRKSTGNLCSISTAQSTKVYSLDDRSLIFEESNNLGSNSGHHHEKNKVENNTLPPLTNQLDNLTLQSKKYCLQKPKERRRTLSGQSATKQPNEALSFKNQRSSSIDYSNINTLLKSDSRSSSLASGRFSQVNGARNNASSEIQTKSNSAHSTFSASRKTPAIFHRSATMSDMLETSKQSTLDCLSPEDAIQSNRRPKKGLRSSSVYSPISVASAEKPRLSSKPIISARRASLPTSTLATSNLISETSRSREFFEALNELKQKSPTAKSGQAELKSSPPSTRREVLHIIQEVHPEASLDTGDLKKKDAEVVETKNGDDTQNTPKDNKVSEAPLKLSEQNEFGITNPLHSNDAIYQNKTDKTEGRGSVEPKKSSYFDISEDPANSKKIFSRLENKKHISSNEQNQHFVVESDLNVEKPCLLLTAATAFDSDYLDNSVVLKDDDDLCDEDFHEKRIILWLMDVSTGDDAESVTRITPPSSPDPSTLESAIRVVYNGD